jgi:hypothetical protein
LFIAGVNVTVDGMAGRRVLGETTEVVFPKIIALYVPVYISASLRDKRGCAIWVTTAQTLLRRYAAGEWIGGFIAFFYRCIAPMGLQTSHSDGIQQ